MTLVVLLALGVGLGFLGVFAGLRSQRASLNSVFIGLVAEPKALEQAAPLAWRDTRRLDRWTAMRVANVVRERRYFERELETRLALTNSTLEALAARCLVSASIGGLLPAFTWTVVGAAGISVPLLVPVGAGIVVGICAALFPVAELNAEANRCRQHARKVICSFLDLVVLGLAGGMGIESALLAAAQLGENAVSRRIFATLSLSRDTGEPPWEALSRLGETLGIAEFSELAAMAGLAGMEGAKIRSTLAARAASIRRHELADAEAQANALTERLFIPGAFLLVGFLIFIGFPAFTRIASGF
jgi:tight adherence protein C